MTTLSNGTVGGGLSPAGFLTSSGPCTERNTTSAGQRKEEHHEPNDSAAAEGSSISRPDLAYLCCHSAEHIRHQSFIKNPLEHVTDSLVTARMFDIYAGCAKPGGATH